MLRKWEELQQILSEDRRQVLKLEGKGFCLVESIVEALIRDYDVHCTYKEVIQKISQQFGVHYLLEEPCEPERGGDQNDGKGAE